MKLFRLQNLGLRRWWSPSRTPHFSKSLVFLRHPLQQGTPLIAVVAIASLTGVIGHRFYNEPQLSVGTPAPQTIRAPKAVRVEDEAATEAARKEALQRALRIFMVSETLTQRIQASLDQYLDETNQLRKIAGPFPFVETGLLSTSTQGYLRQMGTPEFQQTLRQLGQSASSPDESADSEQLALATQAQQELKRFRGKRSEADWTQLIQQITEAQQRYQLALRAGSPTLAVFKAEILLDPTDQDWQVAQDQIRLVLKRILVQGIPPGLPESVIREAVQVHLAQSKPAIQSLGIHLLPAVIEPNLVIDPANTLRQREKISQQVSPVMVRIRKGEIIVREGAPITQANFVLLDHFGLSRRGVNWLGLLGTAALVSGAIAIFVVVKVRMRARLSKRDYILLLLLSLSAPLIAWTFGVQNTSLPAVGLLVSSFYGSVLGGTVILLLAALMPLGLSSGGFALIAIVAGSLVGSTFARQPRSREELALLGVIIAITQGLTYFILLTMTGGALYTVLGAAVRQGLLGLGWSIVALGLSPYLEHVFDLVTPIRLSELANPNRPLLKRLAQQAPGTFQHTLLVSTLAEAGAQALGGNVELVRAGCLYHDIGKMHAPQFFIENQRDGHNKHDDLNDPWESTKIIHKHVTEGLVMARKCRLPAAIQAFIPEHQGTMVVAYFYHQAQLFAAENHDVGPVQEADFRYAGPIPQSRETGIVMLADSCEAALRSLKDASVEVALQMVKKIFKARWQDNQLVDSSLTREDLDVLATVFVDVWLQFHHKRIPYPSRSKPVPALPKQV